MQCIASEHCVYFHRGTGLTIFFSFERECFTPMVDLKFRKALEPSVNASAGTSKRPKLKASGNLCLGFSGGLGSSILLDIVHNTYFSNRPPLDDSGKPRGGTNHPRNASVWSSCKVCYVEVCGAFSGVSHCYSFNCYPVTCRWLDARQN